MKNCKCLLSIVLIVQMLALSACVEHADSGVIDKNNARSEKEIELYLTSLLEGAYSMSFDIELLSKSQMEGSRYSSISGASFSTYIIKGAYQYTYKITDAHGDTGEIRYSDPVIFYDDGKSRPEEERVQEDYKGLIEGYVFKVSTEEMMKKIGVIGKVDDEYTEVSVIGENGANYTMGDGITYVFICTDDSGKAGEMYNELKLGNGSLRGLGVSNLVVTKDETLFDALNKHDVNYGTLSQNEIMLGSERYSITLITSANDYSATVFDGNGDPEDEDYQKAEDFDNILFVYESYLKVFGLKKIS